MELLGKHALQKTLKNRTQGMKYTTSYLNKFELNEKFDDPFIRSVCMFHPQNNDIEYFVIRLDRFKLRTLYIKPFELPERDISYKCCIQYIFDKVNLKQFYKKRILSAFRNTISSQIYSFKDTISENICCKCKSSTSSKYHIDHKETSFCQILDEFLGMKNLKLNQIEIVETTPLCHEFIDKSLEQDWVIYHQKNAKYQVLCATCNMSNGNSNYKPKNQNFDI